MMTADEKKELEYLRLEVSSLRMEVASLRIELQRHLIPPVYGPIPNAPTIPPYTTPHNPNWLKPPYEVT